MARKKRRKKAKRAWALVTRTQAILCGIDFGEVGCPLGLSPQKLREARKRLKKRLKKK